MEVKNKYAYVITQDICNKFIEVIFLWDIWFDCDALNSNPWLPVKLLIRYLPKKSWSTDNYYLGGIVYILYNLLLFLQWASTSCKNEGNQDICSTAHLQPTCSTLAVCWWYNRCPGLGGSWWQADSFYQGILWRGKTSCQTHSRWDKCDKFLPNELPTDLNTYTQRSLSSVFEQSLLSLNSLDKRKSDAFCQFSIQFWVSGWL